MLTLFIVSLQGRLTPPSHKSHRLLTSAYIFLLFSRLSKQLGRSLGTEFRIYLKNSKFTPCRVQISFRHWTILTKANGQTFITLFWVYWIKLWCSEHSLPDEVQFCINVIFRKKKNEVAENEIKASTRNSTEYSNVWSLVCFMCYWNCREDCELRTLRGNPWRESFLPAKMPCNLNEFFLRVWHEHCFCSEHLNAHSHDGRHSNCHTCRPWAPKSLWTYPSEINTCDCTLWYSLSCNTNHSQIIVDLTSAMFTFTENIGYSLFIICRVCNIKDTKWMPWSVKWAKTRCFGSLGHYMWLWCIQGTPWGWQPWSVETCKRRFCVSTVYKFECM